MATGLGTFAPDGSVVFNAPAGFHPPGTEDASLDTPVVQRQAEPAEVPPAEPGPGAAGALGPGAPGGPAGGGGQTNEQLEELAKRLYDKIRERLKAELRLDRERSGRLTDVAR